MLCYTLAKWSTLCVCLSNSKEIHRKLSTLEVCGDWCQLWHDTRMLIMMTICLYLMMKVCDWVCMEWMAYTGEMSTEVWVGGHQETTCASWEWSSLCQGRMYRASRGKPGTAEASESNWLCCIALAARPRHCRSKWEQLAALYRSSCTSQALQKQVRATGCVVSL